MQLIFSILSPEAGSRQHSSEDSSPVEDLLSLKDVFDE